MPMVRNSGPELILKEKNQKSRKNWFLTTYGMHPYSNARILVYSALPDVYGQLYLIPNTQNISLKSWWVGKIIEHGFKRMIITK
jgi:hypothetical protein